jgi:putative phosphoribosyl transferase
MNTEPIFADRTAAGSLLARHLQRFRGPDTVVLGIPRGGVVVGAEVAHRLGARLDVIVARKVPAPHWPELAIGAVTASGEIYLDVDSIRRLRLDDAAVRVSVHRAQGEAQARERLLREERPQLPLAGCTVIVVDDGLATGATMRAALRAVRRARPLRVVAAAPVAAPFACRELALEADEVVCPFQLPEFSAVGQFYHDFTQTTDRDVIRLLRFDSTTVEPGGVA